MLVPLTFLLLKKVYEWSLTAADHCVIAHWACHSGGICVSQCLRQNHKGMFSTQTFKGEYIYLNE